MTASIRWDAPSRLLSVDDDPARPTRRLIDLCQDLVGIIPDITHHILDHRQSNQDRWFEIWPGEHYNLLTAITTILHPHIVWEFGTFTGMGTLALVEGMLPGSMIFTVDDDPATYNWFREEDEKANIIHRLTDNFLNPTLYTRPELAEAELIFIDGPKDGITEPKMIEFLDSISFTRDPIVVFDDIREMNMVYLWRNLKRPKMDMTSFGHFTGTGIVDWNEKL